MDRDPWVAGIVVSTAVVACFDFWTSAALGASIMITFPLALFAPTILYTIALRHND